MVKLDATYNKETKRHRVDCPICPYSVVRAKRDSALHVMSQHVAYVHDAEVER